MATDIKLAIEDWGMYNAGFLACKWWDPAVDDLGDVEQFYLDARKEHGVEPCDEVELFVADSEGIPDIGENENLEDFWPLASEFNNLTDDEQVQVLVALDAGWAQNLEEALEVYDDVMGTGCSDRAELAIEYVDSCHGKEVTDSWWSSYLDYDAMGRDLMMEGNYHEYEGEIYNFCR
jgi:antirestriction protein